MKSYFPGYRKYFLKRGARNAELESKTSALLQGKPPTYPMHMTLFTLHVKETSRTAVFFDSPACAVELSEELRSPDSLEAENAHYELMGEKPECLALVFDANRDAFARDAEALCAFLEKRLDLQRRDVVLSGHFHYTEFSAAQSGIHILMHRVAKEEKIFHITLLNSFDLKRCNRALSKCYSTLEEDKEKKVAFLAERFLPLEGAVMRFEMASELTLSSK